jgi:hypothetical protein
MPDIPSASDIAQKYGRRAGNATQEFREGVERSSDSEWADAAAGAEDAWNQGVNDAAAENRFADGVQSTNKSWQQRTQDLGVQRYQSGVQASVGEYESGFEPYRDVIDNTDLPPRGARGDPGNYDRSRQMGEALHNERQA